MIFMVLVITSYSIHYKKLYDGMAYDLTDIIDTCAAETKATLSEDILASCIQNERLYGIPTYKPYALTPMVIYKQEIADELGIDMSLV